MYTASLAVTSVGVVYRLRFAFELDGRRGEDPVGETKDVDMARERVWAVSVTDTAAVSYGFVLCDGSSRAEYVR